MDPQASQMAPNQSTPMQNPQAKGGFFSFLGKIFALLIVGALLLAGGVYYGMQMNKNASSPKTQISPTAVPKITQVPTTIPSPSATSAKTVTAGGGLAGSVFGKYSISVPDGWSATPEVSAALDKLTITNGNYSITINQGAFGGNGCQFVNPASTEPPPNPQFAQQFGYWADISGKSAQYRRGWNKTGNPAGTIAYTICQKNTDGSYGAITTFGRIDAKSPDPADAKMMADIDSMISSLNKQ